MVSRLGILVGTGILAASATAPAWGETLRFNQWVPRSHHTQSQLLHPWFKKIAAATEGRVKIEPTAASLGSPRAQFDMVRDGVADVVFSVHSYTPARFHLALVGLLPFSGNTAESVSVAYWRVTQKMFAKRDEYKGVKLVALMTSDPGHVYNNKRPIRSIADFRGLKLRVATTVTAEIAAKFGVVPVTARAPKTYEVLANGVADGTFSTLDAFRSWKLEKLLPHFTRFPGGLYFNTFYIAMNQKKWDAISKQDQAAISKLGGESFAIAGGRQWDTMARKGEEVMKAAKTKVVVAQGAFLDKVRAELNFIEKKWVAEAGKRGVDGAEALAFMRAQAAEYEKSMK